MSRHCVVVGAGIVGVSTGIWLRRAGVSVTIIDRGAPGSGTSHGNAGILAACAMVPVTAPGLTRRAPAMLMDRDFPLFLRWAYLPRLLPWLRRYLGHANDYDTRRIAESLTGIVGDSVEQHKSLAEPLGLGDWVTESDYCFAYGSYSDFTAESYVWELRRRAGFVPELLSGQEMRDYEPALGPDIETLAIMKDHGYIRSPGGYVQALAKAFEDMGGTIMRASVQDIVLTDDRVKGVLTDQGRVDCDDLVIATGAWSKELLAKCGLRVPLESERGYHIVFEDAAGGPKRPVMVSSGKFVATPMEQGLRCAGIVEFGGLEAGPSSAPFALLRRQVKRTFPHLRARDEIEWMGHRPAPTDSLPLIGQVGESRVFTAFGHHHIGLTGGPKTGRLVAGLIAGQPVNADLSPYHPQRFS
jgi:D-amino-acid dehydrogenase